MTLPQYNFLHHWYSARYQESDPVTQIDDFGPNDNSGTLYGADAGTFSITGIDNDKWFNLGEGEGGGDIGFNTSWEGPTGSYTWAARVRRSSLSNWANYYQVLLGRTDSNYDYYIGCYFHFNESNPGPVLKTVQGGSSAVNWGDDTNSNISIWAVDEVHFLAASYVSEGATGNLSLYMDGVLIVEHEDIPNPTTNTGENITWFRWASGQSWGHEASDVAFWDGVALSTEELDEVAIVFEGNEPPSELSLYRNDGVSFIWTSF